MAGHMTLDRSRESGSRVVQTWEEGELFLEFRADLSRTERSIFTLQEVICGKRARYSQVQLDYTTNWD